VRANHLANRCVRFWSKPIQVNIFCFRPEIYCILFFNDHLH